jgi:hypothetical protein
MFAGTLVSDMSTSQLLAGYAASPPNWNAVAFEARRESEKAEPGPMAAILTGCYPRLGLDTSTPRSRDGEALYPSG